MFHLIVTNDEEVVRFARERGAGIFVAEKLPEGFAQEGEEANRKVAYSVYDLLRELNVPPNVKGYSYLKFVLEHCQNNSDYHKQSITKGIYPECAEQFGTTPSRVERAIRHALGISFEKAPERYCEIFGRKLKRTPKNFEFICLVSEYFANSR